MMSDIERYDVESESELAPTRRSYGGPDGGYVPGRLAGFTYNGDTYCPDCADDIHVEFPSGEYPMSAAPAFETDETGTGVASLSGFAEALEPGHSCGVCFRRLQTNIIPEDY